MPKIITKKQKEKIFKMFNEGYRNIEVAKKHGLREETISRLRKEWKEIKKNREKTIKTRFKEFCLKREFDKKRFQVAIKVITTMAKIKEIVESEELFAEEEKLTDLSKKFYFLAGEPDKCKNENELKEIKDIFLELRKKFTPLRNKYEQIMDEKEAEIEEKIEKVKNRIYPKEEKRSYYREFLLELKLEEIIRQRQVVARHQEEFAKTVDTLTRFSLVKGLITGRLTIDDVKRFNITSSLLEL